MSQKMNDSQLTKRVEKNLSEDSMYKYPDVRVNVFNSTAQLTGFVDKPEQRQRAAELAAQASGVREVINQIMLKPTPTGPATIRNPMGNETGRMSVDTNAPPAYQEAPQQPGQGGKMQEEINPNR